MDLTTLLFPLLAIVLFGSVFLSSRRQRRQMHEMKSLQASLEAGDVVVTTSGLRATVVDASYEETIDLEIADGVVTTWVRAAVREKVNPVADDAREPDAVTEGPATGTPVSGTAVSGTTAPEPGASEIAGSPVNEEHPNGASGSRN